MGRVAWRTLRHHAGPENVVGQTVNMDDIGGGGGAGHTGNL